MSLPFQSEPSFKLLGLTLDNVWSFDTHMSDTRRKMKMRMAILNKVSNSVWGLENRIRTTTSHARFESLFNYGLTVIAQRPRWRIPKELTKESSIQLQDG